MTKKELDLISDLNRLLTEYQTNIIKVVEDILWSEYKKYDNILDNGVYVLTSSYSYPRLDRILRLRDRLRAKQALLLRMMAILHHVRNGDVYGFSDAERR